MGRARRALGRLAVVFFGGTAQSALAACPPPGIHLDTPLVDPTEPASIVVELRIFADSTPEDVAATIEVFDDTGLPLTVLVPSGWRPDDPGQLQGPSVELGLRTDTDTLLKSAQVLPSTVPIADWRLAIRDARRELRKNTGASVRTISLPPPPPALELAIDESGLRTILVEDEGANEPPRVARSYGGKPGRARLLTEHGYSDRCGAVFAANTAPALNRITRAGVQVPVARVVLLPDPDAARSFVGWWSTVAAPADWVALKPRQAGLRVAGQWLPRPSAAISTVVDDPAPARAATAKELDAIAEAIVVARRLPRSLPGGFSLTEAFTGLNAWASNPQEVVILPMLGGPTSIPATSRRAPGPVDVAQLKEASTTLSLAVSQTVPSLVNVGETTLTVREYLVALAYLKLGQTPVARDTPDPDPYAPDGGWGSSGSP